MLYLSELHSHEGVSMVIPLYRDEDSFYVASNLTFGEEIPTMEVDSYDILDLFKLEQKVLLPPTLVSLVMTLLSEEQQQKILHFQWKEQIAQYPVMEQILPLKDRTWEAVLWVGYKIVNQTMMIEDECFHLNHDGHWTTFLLNEINHLQNWLQLKQDILAEIQIITFNERDLLLQDLYFMWENKRKNITTPFTE